MYCKNQDRGVQAILTRIANPCYDGAFRNNIMPTSNVNLTPELSDFVQSQVDCGLFNNNSEVHRAALAALKKREEERQAKLDWLRGEIQLGLDDLGAGNYTEFDSPEAVSNFIAEIGKEARQELEAEGVKIAP